MSVSTLMLGLVGEVETAGDSVLGLGELEALTSELPLSLSFFPNTRPRIPPLVEALLSELPASLTIVRGHWNVWPRCLRVKGSEICERDWSRQRQGFGDSWRTVCRYDLVG